MGDRAHPRNNMQKWQQVRSLSPPMTSYAVTAAVLFLLLHSAVTASRVPALIVFGDSTADTGNNNALATVGKSDFPPYGRDMPDGRPTGRFSNGRMPTDFISEAVGLRRLVPAYLDARYSIADFTAGVCFASAGSGLDDATASVLSVIPLWKQLEFFNEYTARLRDYLGAEPARRVLAGALYAISMGSNDYLLNYYAYTTHRTLQFTPSQYTDYLVGLLRDFIVEIHGHGARTIAIVELGPLGCVPLHRKLEMNSCNDGINAAAREFNVKTADMVTALLPTLSGARITVLRMYDFADHVLNNPALYGFSDVVTQCCSSGDMALGLLCLPMSAGCPDAGEYAFWDPFHPTEKMSALMSDYIFNTSLAGFLSSSGD